MSRTKINMLGVIQKDWQVIEETQAPHKNTSKSIWWNCKCLRCGKIKAFNGAEIRAHRIGQCKCGNKKKQQPKLGNSQNSYVKNQIGNKYERLLVKSFAYSKNGHGYWNCLCDCGKEVIVRGNSLRTGSIKSCGCLVSYQEEQIKDILIKNNISFKREYTFQDLKDKQKLRFDFAIFNFDNALIGLIEYNGQQHYQQPSNFNKFGLLQKHDEMKKEYCKKNNIPLLILNKNDISNLEQSILNWLN